MNGFHPYPETPEQVREQWRLVNQLLDEHHFEPQMLTEALSNVARIATGNFVPFYDFTAGATCILKRLLRKRSRWLSEGIEMTIAYTADVGATSNFRLTIAGVAVDEGDNLAALTDDFSSTHDLPGPAAADDVKLFTYTNTVNVITAEKPYLALRLVKVPGNPNPNVLRIIHWHVRLLPR